MHRKSWLKSQAGRGMDCLLGDRISEILPDPSRALTVHGGASLLGVDRLEREESPANHDALGSDRKALSLEEHLSIDNPFSPLLLCVNSHHVVVHHFGSRSDP